MLDDNRSFSREFLYKAIDDAQGTIRSLDTKAGVGIVVLGAMVGRILESEQLSAIRDSTASLVLANIFAIFAFISAVLAFLTVFPMVNPAEHVSYPDKLRPSFFLVKFSPCKWLRLFSSSPKYARLEESHESYVSALQQASGDVIESVLAAEVLKVSFIRQLKTDRLVWFARALAFSSLFFVLLLWITPIGRKQNRVLDSCANSGNVVVDVGPTSIVNGGSGTAQKPHK